MKQLVRDWRSHWPHWILGASALALVTHLWLRHQADSEQLDSSSSEEEAEDKPGDIGVRSLLHEMVDLTHLASLPDPPFTARLASSYDRRARDPKDSAGWFANDDWVSPDRPNYERVEQVGDRREYVLLDAAGPGAIVRMWTATPAGTMRIYVDGSSRPVIRESVEDLLNGNGSIPPPFAHQTARGYNAYFPIPFRTACKVTVSGLTLWDPPRAGPDGKFYYQINYRLYSPSDRSRVRTFRRSDLKRLSADIRRVAGALDNGERACQPTPQSRMVQLHREGSDALVDIDQPAGGVIRRLVVRTKSTSEEALRNARLVLHFDGQVTTQVPLGDFFGTGPGLNPYDSLPLSVRPDGTWTCRWPMPFQSKATVRIHGLADVEGELLVEPYPWTDRSLYFHAGWHPEAKVRTRPPRDLTFVSIQGQGAYVGNVLNIENPRGAQWWGEGDDKVYVDGESFPSQFGTGTEDYYGYAWSSTDTFGSALHAQTRADGPRFGGRFSMNRFLTLDRVPFQNALRFDMELWHWDDTQVTWDSVSYYYARPGARDNLTRQVE